MAVHRILTHLSKATPDAREFLSRELELGLEGLSKTNYWSVSDDQKESFVENARARYSDIIASIRVA